MAKATINQIIPLSSGRFIELKKVKFTDELGREREWEAVSRPNSAGAIMIIAKLQPQNLLVMVRQFRPPAGKYLIEFPAGLIDPGEDAGAAAVRELYEETGFKGQLQTVFPKGYSSPGMSGEQIATAVVQIDGRDFTGILPEPHFDAGEQIETFLVEPVNLMAFLTTHLSQGDGIDAKLLAYAQAALLAGK